MRQELAKLSLSASAQPSDLKALRRSSRVPISARLTGSPGSPSPVVVKRGTCPRWRIFSPIRMIRGRSRRLRCHT